MGPSQVQRLWVEDMAISYNLLLVLLNGSYKHSHSDRPFTLAIPKQTSFIICPVRLLKYFFAIRGPVPGPIFTLLIGIEPPTTWFFAFLMDTVVAHSLSLYHITFLLLYFGCACDMAGHIMPLMTFAKLAGGAWSSMFIPTCIGIQFYFDLSYMFLCLSVMAHASRFFTTTYC